MRSPHTTRSTHPGHSGDSGGSSHADPLPHWHLGVVRLSAAFALALDVTAARRAFRRLVGAVDDAPADEPTEPATDRLIVTRVDDPNGRMRLVAVRGAIDEHTIAELSLALGELPAGGRLHLDLSDAALSSFRTMRSLERTVDELELRGVRVRIVGVDPEHPALVPPSPR